MPCLYLDNKEKSLETIVSLSIIYMQQKIIGNYKYNRFQPLKSLWRKILFIRISERFIFINKN